MVQWLKQFRKGKKNTNDGTCCYCGRFLKAEFLKEHGDSLCCIDQDDCIKSQMPETPIEPENTYEDERISADEFSRLAEGIKNFAELEDNWDNEHALTISESAITRAIRLLHVLRRRGLLRVECLHAIVKGRVCVDYYDFEATPEGGIIISGGYINALFEIIIPPDPDVVISFKVGYYNDNDKSTDSQYVQTDRGYTKSYDKIADIIDDFYDNFPHIFHKT